MNNYNFRSTVSSQEAEALKDMIFKRARERAQALTEDVQTSYTNSIQNDVMDLARDSFVSSKNPFSQIVETAQNNNTKMEPEEKEIGFAKRQVNDIKAQIEQRTTTSNTELASSQVSSAMYDTRTEFVKKSSFMGALNFLNSQATISLVKNKGQSFEALA